MATVLPSDFLTKGTACSSKHIAIRLATAFSLLLIASGSFVQAQTVPSTGSGHSDTPFWDFTKISVITEEGISLRITEEFFESRVDIHSTSELHDFGYFVYSVPSLDGHYLRLVEGEVVPWSNQISFSSTTLARAPDSMTDDGSETFTDGNRTFYVVASASGTTDEWVWWECTKAGLCGLGQGAVNIVNEVQDTVIGVANIPAAAVYGIAWTEGQFGILNADDSIRVPYIPSPDWSKDLIVEEDDFSHGFSKFSGAAGVEILTVVWIARTAKFPEVAKLLDKLPGEIGKTGPIKEVPDAKALDDLIDALSDGGETVNSGSYPGMVKELPDGTIIRKRPSSESGGATLDITLPGGTYVKVHIK